MKFKIPKEWITPDEQTGQLPEIVIPGITTTWLQLASYWTSLGYFMTKTEGNLVVMEFRFDQTTEKNEFMQDAWWDVLCDTNAQIFGEIEGWQTAFMVNSAVYPTEMTPLIPNVQYEDPENPGTFLNRLWKQWGSPNHTHYYVADWASPTVAQVTDKYLIPSWSWGFNILGTEMDYGDKISGVNIIPRSTLNQILNDEAAELVVIEQVP